MRPCNTVLLVLFLATSVTTFGQDLIKLSPAGRKVLIDNERVRMIEGTLKPGEKEPMHSHPAYIFYALNAFKVKVTLPDGKTAEAEYKGGEAVWREPVTHFGENIGKTEARFLIIELKEHKK
jgi:quercetin dioxygenase-like cupin family protein